MKQFLVLLLAGLSLVLIQALSWNHVFPQAVRANLSFAFVIFLALYRPFIGSWLLVFLLGYALGALSGVPTGLLPFINLITFFLIRIACKYIPFESLPSQVILVFGLNLSLEPLLLIVTKVVYAYPLGSVLMNVLAHSLLLAALSTPLFALFNKRVSSRELVLK